MRGLPLRTPILAATLALLVLTAALIPVDAFPNPPGGRALPLRFAPRCLSLTYTPESAASWMPTLVRLDSRAWSSGGPPVYHALQLAPKAPGDIMWWPAGSDSLDVQGYHLPRLRLAASGGMLAGRAAWGGRAPVFEHVLALAEVPRAVFAAEVPCPSPGPLSSVALSSRRDR